MRHVLIATHSNLASGFLKSCEYFLEDTSNITVINAFTECQNVVETINIYFQNISDNDEIIAFTDILFGSLNQYLMNHINRNHYQLFTGVNLPMILEFLTKPSDRYLTLSEIEECIQNTKNSIVHMNTFSNSAINSDDE
jgi:mannose/fructose-specific phosphotransferase system component IIA